jgi:hypothetical protein
MEGLANLIVILVLFTGLIFPVGSSLVGFWKRRFSLAVLCLFCALITFSGMDGFASGGANLPIDIYIPYHIAAFLSVIGTISSVASGLKTVKAPSRRVEDVVNQKMNDKNKDMKKCPHCTEMIKQDASFCRYCGQEILEDD